MEIWKDLTGYIGIYQVSSNGRIKSLPRKIVRKNGQVAKVKETILKPGTDRYGYSFVVLCKNRTKRTTAIHRLVAAAFIPNPDNLPEIDHIDGDRANNHADNLRWNTRKQNANNPISIERYRKAGIIQKPYKQLQIPVQQLKDGFLIGSYSSIREAERATGIAHTSISRVIRGTLNTAGGYKWKYKE